MATITLILNALVAIPKIAGYVETFAAAIVSWYVNRQTTETLAAIANAADLAATATTQDQRYAAAQAWQTALQRPRVSST
jgi:hypothetical protein